MKLLLYHEFRKPVPTYKNDFGGIFDSTIEFDRSQRASKIPESEKSIKLVKKVIFSSELKLCQELNTNFRIIKLILTPISWCQMICFIFNTLNSRNHLKNK